jgi:Txe/YoeB family toxin of Txe-Axe toxin-antitoxin module
MYQLQKAAHMREKEENNLHRHHSGCWNRRTVAMHRLIHHFATMKVVENFNQEIKQGNALL